MISDKGYASEGIRIMKDNNLLENIKEKAVWTLRKFANDADFLAGKPFQVSVIDGNLLLNEGINLMWSLIAGGAGTNFANANAYLGVGDDATAADAAQTGLLAATNKLYKEMDATYPTFGTLQKITFRSTFGSSDANFDWKEFTVANGNSGAAVNMNRKISDQGTKVSGQTWELTLEVSLS
jgi:hypothetical protein